jgi:hypothetical protein
MLQLLELLWFGDIDRDDKPDIILQDCPYAGGCRASLYLSSRAKPDELLHKVCEHFWPGNKNKIYENRHTCCQGKR